MFTKFDSPEVMLVDSRWSRLIDHLAATPDFARLSSNERDMLAQYAAVRSDELLSGGAKFVRIGVQLKGFGEEPEYVYAVNDDKIAVMKVLEYDPRISVRSLGLTLRIDNRICDYQQMTHRYNVAIQAVY